MAKVQNSRQKGGVRKKTDPGRSSASSGKIRAKRKANPYKAKGQSGHLKEAANAYRPSGNFIILNGSKKPESDMTTMEKMEVIEKGISKSSFEQLKIKAGLDYDQLSELLNVARATLINKKGNEKFNLDLSERIVGLAEIYSYGYEVFGDQEKFNDWIFEPNRALGQKSPFELLHNVYGREEVKDLIGRIAYGVYS